MSAQDGETFTFHLPNVTSNGSDIQSIEWKQTDKNKLLAIIKPQNGNPVIIHQDNRFQFMQNGSISIREVKQEDTGNYTCKIIYKNGTIKEHNISLTLSSGKFYSLTSLIQNVQMTRLLKGIVVS
ncbi:pregnancy-specific glycoprotein 22-like [Clarias magur]|uniref:Pregnancy-specific glycoprotein 22-like n=1 Tax=Clarias magur TaxID=1594786 RepID=A0A8J4WST7_CLAMG|nr:pregnancy-specific glycoprotein 22-like [Clarias magur]